VPVGDGPEGYVRARGAGDEAVDALRLAVVDDLGLPA